MIKVLDKKVADKIAAGEVIDRPISIIKELVENSIDAGADRITVEIQNGGKSYIRVTDNGCGIISEDVEIAFQRHATSKIAEEKDLDSIYTLGFRGEALASICAVSRVEVMTKTPDAKAGRHVLVEESSILENSAIGCPVGTTITVRDLFYNVPARLKFLASDAAEGRRITDFISRIALSYPDIKFSLINGKNHVFTTSGKGVILNNIIQIYGTDLGKDLIPVEKQGYDMTIKGFVSNPAMSLTSRARQIFCVNGRVVSSSVIESGLEKAYKERLFHGRFPLAFLFLSVPYDKLDVNVHPTKKEIRFDDNSIVEDFVEEAVLEALKKTEAIPNAVIKTQTKEDAALSKPSLSQKQSLPLNRGEPVPVTNVEVIRKPAQSQNVPYHLEQKEEKQVEVSDLLADIRTRKEQEKDPAKSIQTQEERQVVNRPFEPKDLVIIGCVFQTYILAHDANCFYMIDQHAAHERVFYEKFMKQYHSVEKASQQVLIPLTFHVAADIVTMEESWIDQVNQMGYSISYFGNHTYIVREVPSFMLPEEAEGFLNSLFLEFKGGKLPDNQMLIDRIIMRSCKSAVKGGDNLSLEEMKALMNQLSDCRNPFSCPHGRPVFVKMTRYELEKMFKRVQ